MIDNKDDISLDPALKRLIAKAYLNGFAEIHHFTPDQMRKYLSHPKLRVKPASFQDYITEDGLTVRCYTPNGISQESCLPTLVYISATAFVIDRLDANNNYCSLLANLLNMKIINIAHRLSPEYKFPIFLNDCIDSIKWAYQHANDLRIEKEKMAIWGESSGGYLAAVCTHVLRDQGYDILKHQTLFYPMTCLVTPFPSKELYKTGWMLDRPFIDWLDAQCFHPEQDRGDPLVSPLQSKQFSYLPSATIITAEFDPLRDEGEAYIEKLKNAKIPVQAKRYPGMIHGFMRFLNKIDTAKEALEFACEKLRHHFCI